MPADEMNNPTPETLQPCPICRNAREFTTYYQGQCGLLVRCSECGYVASNIGSGRAVVPEKIAGDLEGFIASGEQVLYPRRQKVLTDMARRLVGRVAPGAAVLDVGCGTGEFLTLLHDAGLDVTGLEPWEPLAIHTAQLTGCEVRTGLYDDSAAAGETFDAITLIQVLEHLADPMAAMRQAWEDLNPGGVLMLDFPSIRAPHWLAWRLTGQKRFIENDYAVIPVHLGYYTPAVVRMLLDRAGFEKISITTGRWRYKYHGLLGLAGWGLDPLLNLFGVGGILAFAQKPLKL